jgi:5-methylcytosine-specific restriction endonuclease McrA
MPIKPENKHRYPKNWKDIRASILDRAGHCCEFCGVRNHQRGYRNSAGVFFPVQLRGQKDVNEFEAANVKPPFKIILTIAHLDHTPENNKPENLRALCQRCHLKYDAQHHASNARRTIAAKRANNFQTVLFT